MQLELVHAEPAATAAPAETVEAPATTEQAPVPAAATAADEEFTPAPALAMQAAIEPSPAPAPTAAAAEPVAPPSVAPAAPAATPAGGRVTNDPRVNRRAAAPVEVQTQVLKVESQVAAAAQPDPARGGEARASNDPRKRRPNPDTPAQ
jgi:hypothetical protein